MAPPVVLPFIEEPVVVLLAAGPPACELPPAVAPGDCASASVPVSANAPANNIVVSFMVASSLSLPRTQSARGKLCSGAGGRVSRAARHLCPTHGSDRFD